MNNHCNYTTTGMQNGCSVQPEEQQCGCVQENTQNYQPPCTCRDAFATALRLLCSGDLLPLVDFNRFAFLADNYLIGTYRTCPCSETAPFDNLADTLTGSFNRFTPCSCDLIDVSGTVYDPALQVDPDVLPTLFLTLSENLDGVAGVEDVITALQAFASRLDSTSADFRPELQAAFLPLLGGCSCPQADISEVSLCALDAIAFDAAGSTDAAQEANYQALKQLLSQILNPKCPPPCPPCTPPQPQPCAVPCGCENNGILQSFDRCGFARTISLTAGNLLLVGATLLGAIGDVLILSNDGENRFYFVCAEQVQFIG
ncbi:MAG: hypothetical protein IIY04_03485 [Oscillospiraceae bacterium]|nr:hypothetical protein [Oscillospiraceae bacterium]